MCEYSSSVLEWTEDSIYQSWLQTGEGGGADWRLSECVWSSESGSAWTFQPPHFAIDTQQSQVIVDWGGLEPVVALTNLPDKNGISIYTQISGNAEARMAYIHPPFTTF